MAVGPDEAEVGKRIRLVRKEHGISQRLAAQQMQISRDQLNRVERGEVAVRVTPALRFCEFTNRSPLWLAFGDPENHFGFFWPKAREDEEATWDIMTIGGDWSSDAAIGDAAAQDLTLLNAIRKHRERFPRGARFFATSGRDPRWSMGAQKRIGAPFRGNVKQSLTIQSSFGIVGSMKLKQSSLWPSLRKRILGVVQRRGMKSALARDMGISRQAVGALLDKKRRDVPSAQYAWLSKWVEIAEAQQKQGADVSESPAPKTRKSKSTQHEKAKSSQKNKH